jgi:hypothetical protein
MEEWEHLSDMGEEQEEAHIMSLRQNMTLNYLIASTIEGATETAFVSSIPGGCGFFQVYAIEQHTGPTGTIKQNIKEVVIKIEVLNRLMNKLWIWASILW